MDKPVDSTAGNAPEPDAELARALAGDREALVAVLERVAPPVRQRLTRRIPADMAATLDADDILQVTYIEVVTRIGQFRGGGLGGFEAWVRRIADNNLLDAIRAARAAKRPDPARRAEAGTPGRSAALLIEQLSSAGTGTPSRQCARGEALAAMERLLATLPADYARVIRLYDLRGLPVADVAAELGRSPGAVYMLRARAHERLREAMGSAGNYFTRAGG